MDGSVRQVLRATGMVCTLIGSKAEEWNKIWNDALCCDTLLTLVHAAVLDPDEALGKCALMGAVLERLFHQHMASVVVTFCPQLAWIAFLLSDLPTQRRYESKDYQSPGTVVRSFVNCRDNRSERCGFSDSATSVHLY